LQEQYDYDAFGWPYFYTATGAPAKVSGKAGSPSGNRFLFTAREFLPGLRIYDYRNRLYQPELGRFLQPDPTAVHLDVKFPLPWGQYDGASWGFTFCSSSCEIRI
jgi:RHS repeat-associated protein